MCKIRRRRRVRNRVWVSESEFVYLSLSLTLVLWVWVWVWICIFDFESLKSLTLWVFKESDSRGGPVRAPSSAGRGGGYPGSLGAPSLKHLQTNICRIDDWAGFFTNDCTPLVSFWFHFGSMLIVCEPFLLRFPLFSQNRKVTTLRWPQQHGHRGGNKKSAHWGGNQTIDSRIPIRPCSQSCRLYQPRPRQCRVGGIGRQAFTIWKPINLGMILSRLSCHRGIIFSKDFLKVIYFLFREKLYKHIYIYIL